MLRFMWSLMGALFFYCCCCCCFFFFHFLPIENTHIHISACLSLLSKRLIGLDWIGWNDEPLFFRSLQCNTHTRHRKSDRERKCARDVYVTTWQCVGKCYSIDISPFANVYVCVLWIRKYTKFYSKQKSTQRKYQTLTILSYSFTEK